MTPFLQHRKWVKLSNRNTDILDTKAPHRQADFDTMKVVEKLVTGLLLYDMVDYEKVWQDTQFNCFTGNVTNTILTPTVV